MKEDIGDGVTCETVFMLTKTVNDTPFWRVARSEDQIEKKKKLLLNDIEWAFRKVK